MNIKSSKKKSNLQLQQLKTQWFVERIGNNLQVVQGKDIQKLHTLYHCIYGPFDTKDQADEKLPKILETILQ